MTDLMCKLQLIGSINEATYYVTIIYDLTKVTNIVNHQQMLTLVLCICFIRSTISSQALHTLEIPPSGYYELVGSINEVTYYVTIIYDVRNHSMPSLRVDLLNPYDKQYSNVTILYNNVISVYSKIGSCSSVRFKGNEAFRVELSSPLIPSYFSFLFNSPSSARGLTLLSNHSKITFLDAVLTGKLLFDAFTEELISIQLSGFSETYKFQFDVIRAIYVFSPSLFKPPAEYAKICPQQ